MSEMSGLCAHCDRWFYVPFCSGEEMSMTICPDCATAPSRFRVRTGESSFEVELEVLGPPVG